MLGSALRFPMTRKKPPEIPAGVAPKVQVSMAKSAFRPGEMVVAAVEICHPSVSAENGDSAGTGMPSQQTSSSGLSSYLSGSSFMRTGGRNGGNAGGGARVGGEDEPIWLDAVVIEVKGFERLDPTWVVTARTSNGSGLARGERCILESAPATVLQECVFRSRSSKLFSVVSVLPGVLPPSYKGTAVRYTYMLVVTVRWSIEPPGGGATCHTLVTRTPFRVWTRPNCSGLTAEEIMAEGHYGFGGIVPTIPVEIEMRWRERRVDSGTPSPSSVTAMEPVSSGEDGELSVSGTPRKKSTPSFERSLSFPSISSASSYGGGEAESLTDHEGVGGTGPTARRKQYLHARSLSRQSGLESGGGPALASIPGSPAWSDGVDTWHDSTKERDRDRFVATPRSIDGVGNSSGSFFNSPFSSNRGYSLLGASQANGSSAELLRSTEEEEVDSPISPNVTVMRGRTYNIWINDEILVKFTPRKAQSTYYLGDTVSGTLDFAESGSRRCLEVCVMLETQELINPAVLHPSRKHAGAHTVTKVQTEFHEITANLLSTHFIFTIPVDAPAAFDTPTVSVRWTLRFEFVATCLLKGGEEDDEGGVRTGTRGEARRRRRWGEETERGEWALPLLVHAPQPPSKNNVVSCRRVDTPPGGLSPLRGHEGGRDMMEGLGIELDG